MNNPNTFRCVPSDIKSLDQKVQTIFLVDLAEAMHLYYRSESTGETEKFNDEERIRLVEEAIAHIICAHSKLFYVSILINPFSNGAYLRSITT
jgi:hypothetical protein